MTEPRGEVKPTIRIEQSKVFILGVDFSLLVLAERKDPSKESVSGMFCVGKCIIKGIF
jgi:hypothetical protein